MSFNKACTTGKLFLEILILNPLPLAIMVQSILNLSANTSGKSLTSFKLKPSVHSDIEGLSDQKGHRRISNSIRIRVLINQLCLKELLFAHPGKIDYTSR